MEILEDVMNPCPIDKKFEAFGWNVLVIDGHNYDEIIDAIEKAKECKDKPTVVVCNTVKGKGVSFMENQAAWHGTAPSKEQCETSIKGNWRGKLMSKKIATREAYGKALAELANTK